MLEQLYSERSFPAQILSGTPAPSTSKVNLYSWSEVVIDGIQGWYSGQASARFGVNNAVEINNANLFSGFLPSFARLNYEGSVSGQPFYSFTKSLNGTSGFVSGEIVTGVTCTSGTLTVTTMNLQLQWANGLLVSGYFGV